MEKQKTKKQMKIIIVINLLLLLIFPVFQAQAQTDSKFRVVLDYKYMFGLREQGDFWDLSRKDAKMYGNSLRLSCLYSLFSQLSAGVGIGADRYEVPGRNTIPVFVVAHYSPKMKLPIYFFGNAGFSFKTETITPGFLMDLGIGYKYMFRKHFGLSFQFGYNLKQFKEESSIFNLYDGSWSYLTGKQTRHSLTCGIGLVF
ncbi:MAG: hypothetical protein LBH91_07920 [Prevotellaceae bacterium]|jgi:hypothetical protein|nr:hypothetical protein [Prevotellaceae bacterium]